MVCVSGKIKRGACAYETRIIVSLSRSLHTPQSSALDARQYAVLADEPVSVVRILVLDFLFDHDSKYV